jgi:hypothetical protein
MIQNSDESNYTVEDIKNLNKQIRDFELFTVPKLLADDAASEKLIDLLEEQGGSIAIASPEGGLFSTLKTAASANPAFDAYLKAYTGNSIEVARLSRRGNYIESPKLSLIIACQPKTAMEMIENKTFRDKGLPARFLFANCRSLVGARTFDKPEVNSSTVEAYNELIRQLLDGVFDRNSTEMELTLTSESRAAYIDFSQNIEAKLGDNGEYKFMQDWCAKLPGQMLRIAGILALCSGKEQIELDEMLRAANIASWFTESAAVVFGERNLISGEFSKSLLTRFLDECTVHRKGESVKTSELCDCYNIWAQENGYAETKSRAFVGELKKLLTVSRLASGNAANEIALK